VITLDFETYPIQPFRPEYPPRPVGLAFKFGDTLPGYASTPEDMEQVLFRAWASDEPKLFHNAMFDIDVATEHFNMKILPAEQFEDTYLMAFIADPFAGKIGLKELVQARGMSVEDQTEMLEWIWHYRDQIEQHSGLKMSRKNVGAFIAYAPESLRRRYAMSDVKRTEFLFQQFSREMDRWSMWDAYRREKLLLPILLRNAREGLRVHVERLQEDIAIYERDLKAADQLIGRALGAPDLPVGSDMELARALIAAGEMTEDSFKKTKTGRYSVNKENLLPSKFKRPEVGRLIGYRNRLTTCLSTFLTPWRDQALRWNGRISTQWHQTRGDHGMRSGRIGSSEHNLLNIPKSFDDRDDEYQHPDESFGLSPLPLCRKYVLPDEGEVWLHRDFDGQELRVFGHFENGDLADQYRRNPGLDVHQYIKEQVKTIVGRDIERRKIKVLTFTQLYGGGLPAIAARLRCSPIDAAEFRRCHNMALKGRVLVSDEIARILRRGGRIRTLGGRTYPMPPHAPGDDPSYKMLNYLVQGSSADLTKQCLIDWDTVKRGSRLLVTVYDEINISAAPDVAEREMTTLREIMNADRLKVPMLSKGKRGVTWGDLEDAA
jgi:DNA polymerase I-like protein with 3'-5' exonuclease and polymerase domains